MRKNMLEERQKLRKVEVLMEIEKGARIKEWFEGKIPSWDEFKNDRGEATKDLLQSGLIEEVQDYPQGHPHPFRLTAQGRTFLENVQAKIGTGYGVDWQRLNEIEFP